MSRRQAILLGLFLVAAWLAVFGDKTPSGGRADEIVEATGSGGGQATQSTRRASAGSSAIRHEAAVGEIAALLPRQPPAAPSKGERAARELFAVASWAPPPPKAAVVVAQKPPPPTAPPLPFRYVGKKLEEGRWEVYLERGEQLLIAREGETLAGQYAVKSIAPTTLTLVYLPLQQTQTISIGGPP